MVVKTFRIVEDLAPGAQNLTRIWSLVLEKTVGIVKDFGLGAQNPWNWICGLFSKPQESSGADWLPFILNKRNPEHSPPACGHRPRAARSWRIGAHEDGAARVFGS